MLSTDTVHNTLKYTNEIKHRAGEEEGKTRAFVGAIPRMSETTRFLSYYPHESIERTTKLDLSKTYCRCRAKVMDIVNTTQTYFGKLLRYRATFWFLENVLPHSYHAANADS